MTINKISLLLVIFGYFIIFQGNNHLNSYIGWSLLSIIMLLGILFTYLIEKTEYMYKEQSHKKVE